MSAIHSFGAVLLGVAASTLVVAAQSALPAWLTADDSAKAYEQPVAGLSKAQAFDFQDGERAFAVRWSAMGGGPPPWGLGPLANENSCLGCHAGKGRTPPKADGARLRAMVVRLSRAGTDDTGEPLPHPAYGRQLNDLGVTAFPAEGYPVVDYREHEVTLADGTRVALREPDVRFEALRYGPIDRQTRISLRTAPPLIGLGLLEAVPDEALRVRAEQQAALGLAGRISRVWDRERKQHAIGRFGRKASQPTLRQQIAAAFHDDIGVLSEVYPEPNCAPQQANCRQAVRMMTSDPEVTAQVLDDLTTYLRAAAVPAPRGADDAAVRRGAGVFENSGCAGCHQTSLRTRADAALPALSNVAFAAYTDLLLHDLGDAMADRNAPPGDAEGRLWRTTPLWGLGLAQRVNPGVTLLHDGRARDPTEAILWHGGEGERSREAFRQLSGEDRAALLAFLGSL